MRQGYFGGTLDGHFYRDRLCTYISLFVRLKLTHDAAMKANQLMLADSLFTVIIKSMY